MFRAFYSLAAKPFDKEIKSKDMFASASHQELVARLDYLRENRGIGLVVGEPGLGKTSTIRAFATSLNASLYRVVYYQLATVTVNDFYRGWPTASAWSPPSARLTCSGRFRMPSFPCTVTRR